MAFGKTIKTLRDEANISVKNLADMVGVSADRWRKWEEKDLNPRHMDADKIETFFGKSLDEIGNLKSIKEFLKIQNSSKHTEDIKTESLERVNYLNNDHTNMLIDELKKQLAEKQKELKKYKEERVRNVRTIEQLAERLKISQVDIQETSLVTLGYVRTLLHFQTSMRALIVKVAESKVSEETDRFLHEALDNIGVKDILKT